MALLSIEELSGELSIPVDFINDLIARGEIIPYGGRARLGEPRFSTDAIPKIRVTVESLFSGVKNVVAR